MGYLFDSFAKFVLMMFSIMIQLKLCPLQPLLAQEKLTQHYQQQKKFLINKTAEIVSLNVKTHHNLFEFFF